MFIEAIFIICATEPEEIQKVVVVDLSGAFLHAMNGDDVIMFMRGGLAELRMISSQKYQKYIAIEKGQKVLSAKVHKVYIVC